MCKNSKLAAFASILIGSTVGILGVVLGLTYPAVLILSIVSVGGFEFLNHAGYFDPFVNRGSDMRSEYK